MRVGLRCAGQVFAGHHLTLADDRSGWVNTDAEPELTDAFKRMKATRLVDTPTGSQANRERLD